MDRGYRTIFWGIFFASFHINLGMIPILPQFVGWIIVAVGVGRIQQEHPSAIFHKAGIFSQIVVVLALFSGVFSIYLANASVVSILTTISPIIFGVAELLMEYAVLEGSIEYFYSNNAVILAEEYIRKLRAYTIVFVIFIIMHCITLTFYLENYILISVLIGIILRIWFMILMSSLRKDRIEDDQNNPQGIDLLI